MAVVCTAFQNYYKGTKFQKWAGMLGLERIAGRGRLEAEEEMQKNK